jgi:hypothetical protein
MPLVFRPYPFQVGQRITIEGGSRRRDWEVIGLGPDKVRLRCPLTHKEVEWVTFCFLTADDPDRPWPERHED